MRLKDFLAGNNRWFSLISSKCNIYGVSYTGFDLFMNFLFGSFAIIIFGAVPDNQPI
jgi:hypothetical protein